MSTESECKQSPGTFKPVIDRNRCEGKQACVEACPYDVFSMGTLSPEQRGTLSLGGKLKGFMHLWHQAFATSADACRACGRCVDACPEKAITLVRS